MIHSIMKVSQNWHYDITMCVALYLYTNPIMEVLIIYHGVVAQILAAVIAHCLKWLMLVSQ